MDLSSLPPPNPPSHEVLIPPPCLSFPDQKRHLFDAVVVVGTFPGFEAGTPPCHLAAAAAAAATADGREKKKKKEDKGGGDKEPPLPPRG